MDSTQEVMRSEEATTVVERTETAALSGIKILLDEYVAVLCSTELHEL